jgi:hypothetical protein
MPHVRTLTFSSGSLPLSSASAARTWLVDGARGVRFDALLRCHLKLLLLLHQVSCRPLPHAFIAMLAHAPFII